MANDRQQIVIERELRKLGYQYLRKRQTKGEARRAAGSQFQFIINKDELALAVAGCDLDPSIVREGKERLFEDRYQAVFPNGDPNYYLTRYWLMRSVNQRARGNPERTYARWLVLNFIWHDLRQDVKRHARSFRTLSETKRTMKLDAAIDRVVLAAVKFYRAERGAGAAAVDPSAFSRRQGLPRLFAEFWTSAANPHRNAYEKARAAFVALLAEPN